MILKQKKVSPELQEELDKFYNTIEKINSVDKVYEIFNKNSFFQNCKEKLVLESNSEYGHFSVYVYE